MASALSGGTHRLLLGRPGIVTMLLVFLVLVANSPLVLSLDIRKCIHYLMLTTLLPAELLFLYPSEMNNFSFDKEKWKLEGVLARNIN